MDIDITPAHERSYHTDPITRIWVAYTSRDQISREDVGELLRLLLVLQRGVDELKRERDYVSALSGDLADEVNRIDNEVQEKHREISNLEQEVAALKGKLNVL